MPEKFASPKEWAIAKGFNVKLGKGRMPKDAADAFKAALSRGDVVIDNGKPVRQKPTAAPVRKPDPEFPEDGEPISEKVKSGNGLIEPAPRMWPESTRAYGYIDGKKVETSMRNCCFNCGVSLGWCACGMPRAIVANGSYIPVTLEV